MPLFFVFAVIFTILMLEQVPGDPCFHFTEVLLYLLLCLLAYLHPEYITAFVTEADRLIDVLAAFLSVSIGCGNRALFSSEGIRSSSNGFWQNKICVCASMTMQNPPFSQRWLMRSRIR